MKVNKNIGFTLVELIVVIVILAVLAVISFMMVTKWINKSSNARAASDVGTITRALHGHYGEKGTYPETSKPIGMLSTTGLLLGEQGVFDEEVIKSLGTFSKLPKDPQANDYYMYTVIKNPSKGFEVGAVFENPEISVLGTKVYADGAVNAIPYVQSNYHGKYYNESGIPIFPKPLSVFDQSSGKYLQESTIGVNGELLIDISQLTGKQMSTFNADGIMVGGEYGDFIIPKVGYLASGSDSSFSTGVIMQALPTGVTSTNTSSIPSSSSLSSSSDNGSWCYYKNNTLANAHVGWTSSELYYNTGSNSCYVFGDEDIESKAACDKWLTDNVTLGGSWVWVPARRFVTDGNGIDLKNNFYQRNVTYNGHNYICRGFAVMKYEAKFAADQKSQADAIRKSRTCSDYTTENTSFCSTLKDGGIASTPENFPIGRIRQGEAINACGTGGTYHLMTNNEWMAIARNVENQNNNWSNGTVGNGFLYVGHTDRGPTQLLQASINDNDSYTGTNDSNLVSDGEYYYFPSENAQSSKGQKRTLFLSNGKLLWDFSGNSWEHVNRGNNPLSISVTVGNGSMCTSAGYWYTNGNPANTCSSNYGPLNSKGGVDIGMGYVYNSTLADKIFIRGGSAAYGDYSGVYAFYLLQTSSYQTAALGFRCVR